MSDSALIGALFGLHAQTSLHAGAGTALGVVDLPIQRERHTHWPTIAGSAIKGVLRDAYREHLLSLPNFNSLEQTFDEFEQNGEGEWRRKSDSKKRATRRQVSDAMLDHNVLFGPPTENADAFAGALSITDARLVAFPVRSLKGVFAWASCPSVLNRLARDARLAGMAGFPTDELFDVPLKRFVSSDDSPCLLKSAGRDVLVLEEFDFSRAEGKTTEVAKTMEVAKWISGNLLPSTAEYSLTRSQFLSHFVVLSDDDFTHFARHSTEVTARIALDYDSKTVRDGALFYQEFLPPESILYSVVLLNPTRSLRKSTKETETAFANWAKSVNSLAYLQLGGDETTGKGLCAVRLQASREVAQ